MDVEYFPFDEQTCVMKFGSWTYDGFQVMLMAMLLVMVMRLAMLLVMVMRMAMLVVTLIRMAMLVVMVMTMTLTTRWICATRTPESHKCEAMFGQSQKPKG